MVELTINKVVIHSLVKEQHKAIKPSVIRTAVLNHEHEAVIKTVSGVLEIYGTRHNSSQYGIFASGEARGAFPDAFNVYTTLATVSNQDFIELSKEAMRRLFDKAENTHTSSGGNILFADYTSSANRYFLIAMIKQKPGITLTAELEPTELMHLDLSRLNQAARISFSKLADYQAADTDARQELNYLSFISSSTTKAASGYFVSAIGCTAGTAAAQATRALIIEAKKFFQKEELRTQKEAFTNSLMEYLQRKIDTEKSVKLSEIEQIARKHIPETLSDRADDIANEFLTHLNSEECGVPIEFAVSNNVYKKFTHITGESNSWKMTFDRAALGTDAAADVYYDRATNKLTLRDVPGTMKALIEAELNDRSQG